MSSANYHKGGAFFGLVGKTNVTSSRLYKVLVEKSTALTAAATAIVTEIDRNTDKIGVMQKIADLKELKKSVDAAYSSAVARSVSGGKWGYNGRSGKYGGKSTRRRRSSGSKTSKRR